MVTVGADKLYHGNANSGKGGGTQMGKGRKEGKEGKLQLFP